MASDFDVSDVELEVAPEEVEFVPGLLASTERLELDELLGVLAVESVLAEEEEEAGGVVEGAVTTFVEDELDGGVVVEVEEAVDPFVPGRSQPTTAKEARASAATVVTMCFMSGSMSICTDTRNLFARDVPTRCAPKSGANGSVVRWISAGGEKFSGK